MGIQYVTVKVDTSGLYQPVSASVGVVGIIGAAPSAGAGFDNPTLFTRALTGIDGEPYARVVPVLHVATAAPHAPLDLTGAPIANIGWAQPKDSKGNVIGPFQLVDTSAASFSPLSVDTAARTLRRANGAAFQSGGTRVTIVLDAFSIVAHTVTGVATFWGAPLDNTGQPVPNLLMRPDTAPATGFVDLSATALTIDGTLGSASGGTGKPKAADGTIYNRMTFDICDLAKSINLALTNGALQVWAFRLDPVRRSTTPPRRSPTSPTGFSISCACRMTLTRTTSPRYGTTSSPPRQTTPAAAARARASGWRCFPRAASRVLAA